MIFVIIGAIVFILLLISIILIRSCFKKVNIYVIKINEAIKNIDLLLEKKLTLLTKIKDNLKDSIDENIMENLPKIKNKSLDNFELDEQIVLIEKDLKDVLEYNKKVILNDEANILLHTLERANIDLSATKEYYNDNCEIYNSIIGKFPINIIAKIKHLDILDFYENKKEEEFEILKEK